MTEITKTLHTPIGITAISSISSLGGSPEEVRRSYAEGSHRFSSMGTASDQSWVATLDPQCEEELDDLARSEVSYANLDRSVQMALVAARKLTSEAGKLAVGTGVNLGSSRGATATFEQRHKEFLESGYTAVLTSPTTTLGNLSSWIAQDLGCQGPAMSHSVTCSTALHAMLNGIAWIKAGMSPAFLVGGSEAPLTAFTLAQMKALRIYSRRLDGISPCASMEFDKTDNTMVLGEATALALIEPGIHEGTKAVITGFGAASEELVHPTSLSAEGKCFVDSMKLALKEAGREQVDAVVMHAPGTVLGDKAELAAIDSIFVNRPLLTSNKWMAGHTLGASGMLSLEMGVIMLETGAFIPNPFYPQEGEERRIRSVMVNAVGFGGNAVSILIERP